MQSSVSHSLPLFTSRASNNKSDLLPFKLGFVLDNLIMRVESSLLIMARPLIVSGTKGFLLHYQSSVSTKLS